MEERPAGPAATERISEAAGDGTDKNVRNASPAAAAVRRIAPYARAVLRFLRRPPRWLILALLAPAIVAAYAFFDGAGKLHNWPTYNEFFDSLAEGFRSGHLHMSWAPSPELLSKANPYDPANAYLWGADLSLYNGHYYLYWGPVPALLIAAVKVTFRLTAPIGDQYALFALSAFQLVFGMLLVERMARWLFTQIPFALIAMAVLVLAFANPTPYLLATAGVYQTAIVGAQAFLIAGMYFAFGALWAAASAGRTARAAMAAAGACWAASIGCRASLGPPVLLLVILTALLARPRAAGPWKSLARNLVWLGAPVAAGVGLLLLYNKLRFGGWLEFGQRYQLNTIPFRHRLVYILPNVYSYLLRPVMHSCRFPFLGTIWNLGARAFPVSFRMPHGYEANEPVVGILVVAPWAWLAPIGFVAGARAWVRALRAPGGVSRADDGTRGRLWCVAAFAIIAFVTILPVIAIYGTTMRYLGDLTNGILLAGVYGAWWLYEQVRQETAWRRLVVGVLALFTAATVVAGALLGFVGYIGHFRHNNPTLMHDLERQLSFCEGGRVPKEFGD